ncbi:hypothetical protein BS47DRAFT_1351395 [Hydnum rufescens UP504]|uniref:Uncharacterized protein n=1 Tax=Hydnum rufescens UP504 TaxID=1448309 RepID=A0A9P6DM63_9AGAM|nr:hypothetical protein BS47DRAFT_1351395 [Hydnum rufescens UP504]
MGESASKSPLRSRISISVNSKTSAPEKCASASTHIKTHPAHALLVLTTLWSTPTHGIIHNLVCKPCC